MTKEAAMQAQSNICMARVTLETLVRYFERGVSPVDTYFAEECYRHVKALQDVSNLLRAEFWPVSLPEDATLDVISSYVEKRLKEVPF